MKHLFGAEKNPQYIFTILLMDGRLWLEGGLKHGFKRFKTGSEEADDMPRLGTTNPAFRDGD